MSKFKKISAEKASELFDLGRYLQFFDDFIYFYEEDTYIDGNLLLEYDRKNDWTGIIVNGNLEVNGCIKNYEGSYGPFLFVTGNLTAKSLIAGGSDIVVKGNVNLENVMLGYQNNGKVRVNGDVKAKIVISENHIMEIMGSISAIKLNDGGNIKDANYDKWFTVIKDSLLNDNGKPIWEKLFDDIERGNSILKGDEDDSKDELFSLNDLDIEVERDEIDESEAENEESKSFDEDKFDSEEINNMERIKIENLEDNQDFKDSKNENINSYTNESDNIESVDLAKNIFDIEVEEDDLLVDASESELEDIDIIGNADIDEEKKLSDEELNEILENNIPNRQNESDFDSKNNDEDTIKNDLNKVTEIFEKITNEEGNGIENNIKLIENRLNIKLKPELKNFLEDITNGIKVNYKKWKINDKNDIFVENKFKDDTNLFEQYIIHDQEKYNGTALIGVFTNTVYIGETGDGDVYLAFYKDNKEKTEIIYYNYLNSEFEFYFTDSIESMRKVNVLLDAIYNYESEEFFIGSDLQKKIQHEFELLKDKVTLPNGFKRLEEFTGVKTEYKDDKQEAIYLYWKSVWIIHLLKYNGTVKFDYIAEVFNLIKRQPITDEAFNDFIREIDTVSIMDIIYKLFYLFFFKKEKYLKSLISVCENKESRVVKYAVELIKEFLNGRESIGYVKNIFMVRDEFLKLVNDPDNNEDEISSNEINNEANFETENNSDRTLGEIEKSDDEQEYVSMQFNNQNKVNNSIDDIDSSDFRVENFEQDNIFDDEKSIELGEDKLAEIIINSTDKNEIIDLSWDFIDNNFMMEKIFESLKNRNNYLKKDFCRLDYILNNNEKSDEIDEILEVLLFEKTNLSSYLYSLGYGQFGENYIKRKLLWLIVYEKEKVYDFANKFNLKYLPDIAVKLLEEKILAKLPKKEIIDSYEDIEKIVLSIEEYKYVLPKIKKRKIIKVLSNYLDLIDESIKNNKVIAKDLEYLFGKKFIPLIVELCMNINDPAFIGIIKRINYSFVDDEFILIGRAFLGDLNLIDELNDRIEKQYGNENRKRLYKFLYNFTSYKNNKELDLNVIYDILSIYFENSTKRSFVYRMALEVISKNDKNKFKELATILMDSDLPQLREYVIACFIKEKIEYNILFLDKAYVDYIYEMGGIKELMRFFNNDSAIFKHNIIIKLSEENENVTKYNRDILTYLNKVTEYNSYYEDSYIDKKEGILFKTLKAVLSYKEPLINEFLIQLINVNSTFYKKANFIDEINKINCSENVKDSLQSAMKNDLKSNIGEFNLTRLSDTSLTTISNAQHSSTIISLISSDIYDSEFSISEDGLLISWNRNNIGFVNRMYDYKIKAMKLSKSGRFMFIISDNKLIKTDNFTGITEEKVYDDIISDVSVNKEDIFIITSENKVFKNDEVINISYNSKIKKISLIKNKLIIIDINNNLTIYNIDKNIVENNQYIRLISDSIKIFKSENNSYIHILNGEKILEFDLENNVLLKEIYLQNNVDNMLISNDKSKYYILDKNVLEVYDSKKFECIKRKVYKKDIKVIETNRLDDLYLGFEGGDLFKIKN
jgi:hypothetical protein